MADKNALAELAERLKRRIAHHRYVYENQRQDDIIAQRIVAELAKVYAIKRKLESQMATEAIGEWSKTMDEWVEADGNVVSKCLAIAEEGGAK